MSGQGSRLIGVAGGSGAGKSTFIGYLRKAVPIESRQLSMDDYYLDQSDLVFEERIRVNYDSIDSIDVGLFVEHLDTLKRGCSIETPKYDFAMHTRSNETSTLQSSPVVFLDGIMLLAIPEIRTRLDLAIFLDFDESIRFEQRCERDTRVRGRTEESVRDQWEATVQPAHDAIVQPSAAHADVVIRTRDFERLTVLLAGTI